MLPRLGRLLHSAYTSHLLATNLLASGGLLCLGDAIQQQLERWGGGGLEERDSHWDWNRSARMLAMGLFHGGPRHVFYIVLDRLEDLHLPTKTERCFNSFDRFIPGRSPACAVKKIFFDQTVLSIFIDSTFLYGMCVLEGQGCGAAWAELGSKAQSRT